MRLRSGVPIHSVNAKEAQQVLKDVFGAKMKIEPCLGNEHGMQLPSPGTKKSILGVQIMNEDTSTLTSSEMRVTDQRACCHSQTRNLLRLAQRLDYGPVHFFRNFHNHPLLAAGNRTQRK
jgi:hypothetical protein